MSHVLMLRSGHLPGWVEIVLVGTSVFLLVYMYFALIQRGGKK